MNVWFFRRNQTTYFSDNHQDHKDFRNNPEHKVHIAGRYILQGIHIRVYHNDQEDTFERI